MNKVLAKTNTLFPGHYCECQLLSKSFPVVAGLFLEHSRQTPGVTRSHEHTLTKQLSCDKAATLAQTTSGPKATVTAVSGLWQCWVESPARIQCLSPTSVIFCTRLAFSQTNYVHLWPVPHCKCLTLHSRLCISQASQRSFMHVKVWERVLPTPHRIFNKVVSPSSFVGLSPSDTSKEGHSDDNDNDGGGGNNNTRAHRRVAWSYQQYNG